MVMISSCFMWYCSANARTPIPLSIFGEMNSMTGELEEVNQTERSLAKCVIVCKRKSEL